MNSNDFGSKGSEKYVCNTCDYITCRKSQYDRHLYTDKHKKRQISMISINSVPKSTKPYVCEKCNKNYCDKSGLWRHTKKCILPIKDASNNYIIDTELVMLLIKENSELKNMMMEVIKNGTHNTNNTNNNTHNTTNTNSHNKTFNLQFFLNETCKNAMNIMDFVDSLKLQLNDLERMGEIGFVNGMSNIIIKNLQSMDVTERPVHCTDQKREVMYVKDDGKWDKEEESKPKLRKAIKYIAHKNVKLIAEFKEKHPDYKICASKISTQYNTMVIEAMGGVNCVDSINENKIIKRISKEIMVEKEAN
jgi:hypothetical protein